MITECACQAFFSFPQHKGGGEQEFCHYRDTTVLPCQQDKFQGILGVKKADLEVGRQLGLLPIALGVGCLFLDESESYLAIQGSREG